MTHETRSRISYWTPAIGFVAAGVMALTSGGCSYGTESTVDPRPTPGTSSAASPTAPPEYAARGFDICQETDRELLGDLAHRTDKIEPEQNTDGPDEQVKCVFRMRDANGGNVLLTVTAMAHPTAEEAETQFTDGRRNGADKDMRDDGDVAGIGDAAYAKSRDDYHGLSQNLVIARAANLVVQVFLSVEKDESTSGSELASKTRAVVKDLIARAPRR